MSEINFTQRDIIDTAMRQSAVDMGCSPEDFLKTEPVIVPSRVHSGARAYLEEPLFFDIASYGSNIVAQCVPEMAEFARDYVSRADIERCFETPFIYGLNDELAKYGETTYYMAVYYLPDLAALNAFDGSGSDALGYETRILRQGDFTGLYTPEWGNALSPKRPHLDMIGAGAYLDGRLVGLAGASADCVDMWQIGIDVLPEYRRAGIASALVNRLAREILSIGKVPFYCAAWSNVKSAKCAMRAGFRTAWAQMTAKKI